MKKTNSTSEHKPIPKFALCLKKLIDESGENVSAISRNTNVERTSIHKQLNGERKLNYKSAQALAKYFNLTVDQRKEYFMLYNLLVSEDKGEVIYENRQAVRELLNSLSVARFSPTTPSSVDKLDFPNHLLLGEYSVNNAVHNILLYETSHSEKARFLMYLPEKLDITQQLIELWLADRDFTADVLLWFRSNAVNDVGNINALRSVIPLCLASKGKYRPFYFHEAAKSVGLSPLSHYIITPNYLILLSEDLSAAQISEDKELIEFYSKFFMGLLEYCEPLVKCSSNILEVLQEYISNTAPDSLNILMPQPCPGRYITPDVIRKYMNNDTMPYKEMFALVEQHFSVLRKINGTYQTVFSEGGLSDLINSCSMADLPPQYVPPLEAKDIKQMLIYLYKEIENGTVQGIIVKPSALQLPDYISIYVSQNGLHIYTTNSFIYGAYCCNIHISEESICGAFTDFMKSLTNTNLVYSKEDTLKLLKQHISEMDA